MESILDSKKSILAAIDECKNNLEDLPEDFLKTMDIVFGDIEYSGQDEDQEYLISLREASLSNIENLFFRGRLNYKNFNVVNSLEFQLLYETWENKKIIETKLLRTNILDLITEIRNQKEKLRLPSHFDIKANNNALYSFLEEMRQGKYTFLPLEYFKNYEGDDVPCLTIDAIPIPGSRYFLELNLCSEYFEHETIAEYIMKNIPG